ncbi:DNA glycosylase, partial [Auriscalpium vulgare]
ASAQTAKKLKLHTQFASASPFPDFPRPTPAEARDVHALLAAHAPAPRALTDDTEMNAAATCGAVANVLDALIGTLLSQHTSSARAAAAKRSLDAAFGRHAFAALARAPRAALVAALRPGGLAVRKAATIHALLAAVHARHAAYSLQHLADPALPDAHVTAELLAYPGVGPKTAACVRLFCLGRPACPVDTHVRRAVGVLGWVPRGADAVRAQMHLEARVPAALQRGLHVGMVRHGRACRGCKGAGKGECVLKSYVEGRRRAE